MFRFTLTAFALISLVFADNLPSYRWIHKVDDSGQDTFAGLGVDSQGNTYIAGSTLSATFPVKSAVQNRLASAGLYRIDGPGPAYSALPLTSVSSVVVDPQNPNTLYATAGALMRSTDGGATFSALPVPSSRVAALAVDPSNDAILYAGTTDLGAFKSTDGGATWTAINNGLNKYIGQFTVFALWIDPTMPTVLLASTPSDFVRTTDGGASWQTVSLYTNIQSVAFDISNPGVVYATGYSAGAPTVFKSTDHGQTFAVLTTPSPFASIVADPNRQGRLLASGRGGIYESNDDGSTWNLKLTGNVSLIVPDWASGFLYGVTSSYTIIRISSDLETVTPVGPPALGTVGGIAVANGHAFVAVAGTHDVFVMKLDTAGNIVYSTYFGGSAEDIATAMTVDAAGNVYVTGTTTSRDFPAAKGAFASSGGSFLFRLNPDGSLGYSTYFADSRTTPTMIAVDGTGSAYLAGMTFGNLPITPGALQSSCNCDSVPTLFLTLFPESGFLTKFDSAGSKLIYSTYIAGTATFAKVISGLALAPDGTAYIGGANGIYHVNSTGSSLLSSSRQFVNAPVISVAPDGSVYLAGTPYGGPFALQPTSGTFQTTPIGPPPLPGQTAAIAVTAIVRVDPQLATVLAATYYGPSSTQIKAMTTDAAGNVYVGGSTSPQLLPTRTPLQGGFASITGFLSELSGDLSTLLFSSYFGNTERFRVASVAVGPAGTIIGGSTGEAGAAGFGPSNIYVNNLALVSPPALRIDAVENAASLVDGSISAGETIVVSGAGFGSDAQILIDDVAIPSISSTISTVTAVVPQSVSAGAVRVQVRSGGANSNAVLVRVTPASPGIYSADGSGYGQGYIFNKDGTLNTPSNPAKPGEQITVFATGVGPMSFTQGYAVTDSPVSVFVDGFYANGVAAIMGPVKGLPGDVFQISVYVPVPSDLAKNNPDLANFRYPSLVGVTMLVAGTVSQNGIAISIAQ